MCARPRGCFTLSPCWRAEPGAGKIGDSIAIGLRPGQRMSRPSDAAAGSASRARIFLRILKFELSGQQRAAYHFIFFANSSTCFRCDSASAFFLVSAADRFMSSSA